MTMHVYVLGNGSIQGVGQIPISARRLDTQEWVLNLRSAPIELQEACGWHKVLETPKPEDTDTTTFDMTVEAVNSLYQTVWVERQKTDAEISAEIELASVVAPADQIALLAELLVASDVKAGALTDEEVAHRAALFPPWKPGLLVLTGQVYRWDNTLVEVLQGHTTQADWTPDVATSLFKVHRTPDAAPFVQPTGAHDAYNIDDLVIFEGLVYRSLIDANTYSPTAYPAGWAVV